MSLFNTKNVLILILATVVFILFWFLVQKSWGWYDDYYTPYTTPYITPYTTPEIPVCEQESWTCEECQTLTEEDGICIENKYSFCNENYGCNIVGEEYPQWVCEDTCQPEVTPTPEEPTSTVVPVPQTPPTFAGSSTDPFVCSDSVPAGVANIYVDSGISNDGKLEVRWLSEEPKAPRAHIRYTEGNGENWQFALLNTENDGIEEISDLRNGVHYNFQVAQVNGCAVGKWSKTYDPLP